MKHFGMLVLMVGMSGPGAWAADGETRLREAVECFPAKEIVKFFGKFNKLDADRRDTVDVYMPAQLKPRDGVGLPDRMFFRDGETQTDFAMSPEGHLTDFAKIKDMPKSGDLCVYEPDLAGQPMSENMFNFSMDLEILFKNRSGTHSLEELKDGGGDGKSFYKRIVPAPMRLMIPSMTHVSVEYLDPIAEADISALNNEQPVEGLIIERFGNGHIIEVEHLEVIGADTLVIGGGPYKLEPTPSIEKMKKLGFGAKEDGDGE